LLRDRVCVRDICVNTVHKGGSVFTYNDDDDDDDNNNNNNNNNNISHLHPVLGLRMS
jgi:hypothetical protein